MIRRIIFDGTITVKGTTEEDIKKTIEELFANSKIQYVTASIDDPSLSVKNIRKLTKKVKEKGCPGYKIKWSVKK